MQQSVYLRSVAKTDASVAALGGRYMYKAVGEIKYNVNGVNLPRAAHSRSDKQEYKLC